MVIGNGFTDRLLTQAEIREIIYQGLALLEARLSVYVPSVVCLILQRID